MANISNVHLTRPAVVITPRASTDALAAVNLLPLPLPLPQRKLSASFTARPATPGSRPTSSASIMSASLNISVQTHRVTTASANPIKANGAHRDEKIHSKQHDISPGPGKHLHHHQQQQQQHSQQQQQQQQQNGADNPMSNEGKDSAAALSRDGSEIKTPIKGITKPASIEIIERLNIEKPTKMIMAADSQTTGSNNNTSVCSINNVSSSVSTTSTPGSNVGLNNNTGPSKPLRPQPVRMKSRPKMRKIVSQSSSPPPPSPAPQQQHHQPTTPRQSGGSGKKHTGIWHHGRFDTRGSPLGAPYSWDVYLKMVPAKVAPKEAFRQPDEYPQNLFALSMKLEARDPRNPHTWSLASVVGIEGLHIRLRLEGTDAMNDLYELVDSENIRPIGSCPGELLLAPTGFTGNIANYPKFVEKTLKDSIIAGPDCFPPTPKRPARNLFEVGMKLEAVDRKNRDLICPATIAEVKGDTVKIAFDGWRGTFDYDCEYYSRDLFPINWCRDVGRPVQPPANWVQLLEKERTASHSAEGLPPTSCLIRDSLSPEDGGGSPPNSDQDSLNSGKVSETRSEQASTDTTTSSTTQPTKRPRGRPKKHTSLEKTGAPQAAGSGAKYNLSSTPKKNIPDKNSTMEDSLANTSLESDPQTTASSSKLAEDDLSGQVVIQGFQCQRAVPYPDCLKGKVVPGQMPQYSSTSGPLNDEQDRSSSNISETKQSASIDSQQTGSNQALGDGEITSEQREQQKAVKKRKTETTEATKLHSKNPSAWTIDEVLDLIETEESLVKYSDVFREHEIDGKAFMLLTTDILVNHMGLKIGPVLKINDLLERVKRELDMS